MPNKGTDWHLFDGEVTLAETSNGEIYVNSRNQTSKSNALMRIPYLTACCWHNSIWNG